MADKSTGIVITGLDPVIHAYCRCVRLWPGRGWPCQARPWRVGAGQCKPVRRL